MIARFYAKPYRDSVVKAAKGKYNLVGAEQIHEDLTKMDSDLKTKAYPKMKRAHDEGKRVEFQKGKLFINGEETPIWNIRWSRRSALTNDVTRYSLSAKFSHKSLKPGC